MAEYRLRATGEVLTQGELRRRNSSTSFPAVWDQAVLEYLQIDPIFAAPQPSNTDPLKTIRKNGVIQDNAGKWIENWEVVDLFSGENKAQQETEYLAKRNEEQWKSIREQRDNKLKETDWLSIRAADTGTPMSQDWSNYRQSLRDITNQSDPFSITWPEKPTQ